jgi:DNA-binding NtrC family response regulator
VRELVNEIERGVLLYNEKTGLQFDYLRQLPAFDKGIKAVRDNDESPGIVKEVATAPCEMLTLPVAGVDLATLKKRVIEQALLQCDRNPNQAAALLHIKSAVLIENMHRLAIDPEQLEPWHHRLPEAGIDLDTLEQSMIKQALERTNHNISASARLLNISRDILRYRLEKQ